MNTTNRLNAKLILGLVALALSACASPAAAPSATRASTRVQTSTAASTEVPPTLAPSTTPTTAPTNTPAPTNTEVPPTLAPSTTPTTAPTNTPAPVNTLAPTQVPATRVPVTLAPSATPLPTETPTSAAPVSDAWFTDFKVGAHGVNGKLTLTMQSSVYPPHFSDGRWYVPYELVLQNMTAAPLTYGYLGILYSGLDGQAGGFALAWDGAGVPGGFLTLDPAGMAWKTYVTMPNTPGRYSLVVTMCFSPATECPGGGVWENVSPALEITLAQ